MAERLFLLGQTASAVKSLQSWQTEFNSMHTKKPLKPRASKKIIVLLV